MSCYLNIYLVPKVEGEEKDKESQKVNPIFLTQYSRNSDVYSVITENMAVPYTNNTEDVYADLTPQVMQEAKKDVNGTIDNMRERTDTLYKVLKESYNEELKNDIVESELYIKELQDQLDTIDKIKFIVDTVYDSESDFEKVVVNQG